MFGKKKKAEKQNVKTFIDGQEQTPDEIPVPKPAETPALEPSQAQVQEPPPQPNVVEFHGDCVICFDYGFYADNVGVWHNCPRCNPKSMKKPVQAVKPAPTTEYEAEAEMAEEKPSKGNLYEFRFCSACKARNEVHKRKVKWQCEACGFEQEVSQ